MRPLFHWKHGLSSSIRAAGLLALGLCLLSVPGQAETRIVDCTGAPPPPGVYSTITDALNSLPLTATAEIHVITVTGTCVENVQLFRVQNINIQAPVGQTATVIGAPSPPSNAVFDLVSATPRFSPPSLDALRYFLCVSSLRSLSLCGRTFLRCALAGEHGNLLLPVSV